MKPAPGTHQNGAASFGTTHWSVIAAACSRSEKGERADAALAQLCRDYWPPLFLAAAGDKARAHEKIDEALKLGQGFGHFHHTAQNVASAAENGYPNLTWFERDPNLNKLRKDSRFIEFLKKLKPRFQRLKALAQSSISAKR
jgi:hypothetical protein